MEIRPFKLDRPDQSSQGLISYCLDSIGRARQELDWPSRLDSETDNFINVHLAQVLAYGVHPDEKLLIEIRDGQFAVAECLHRQPTHHRYYVTLIEFGKCALFYHSQCVSKLGNSSGRWADERYWNDRLVRVGQSSYWFAAGQLSADDLYRTLWRRLAKNFLAYSQLLHEAGIELGFTDTVPSGIITPP